LALLLIRLANTFLAVNSPISSQVLIVEGWLPDYAFLAAQHEFKRGEYRYVITTGGPLAEAGALTHFRTGAEFAAAKLQELGVPGDCIVVASSNNSVRDRTYGSALAVKKWLQSSNPSIRAVNVFSLAAHARRTRLLFQKALGEEVKVGVFASPDVYYDPSRWWASSEGVRVVLSEAIAYVYARCVFPFLAVSAERDTTSKVEYSLGLGR
jgi:uncharacterized SAM-binding protein YcdF (DUF218 family)